MTGRVGGNAVVEDAAEAGDGSNAGDTADAEDTEADNSAEHVDTATGLLPTVLRLLIVLQMKIHNVSLSKKEGN